MAFFLLNKIANVFASWLSNFNTSFPMNVAVDFFVPFEEFVWCLCRSFSNTLFGNYMKV